jgi:multidrug efflux pump subunit AcrA (membrane-fusion protein)
MTSTKLTTTKLLPFALLSALAALSAPIAAQRPTLVQVTQVKKQRLVPEFEILGEARAVRRVDVGTEVEGLVDELEVEEGDRVEAETRLLALETTQREISLRAARARLQIATQQLREYQEGSRKEDIAEARADVARAQALVVDAEDELRRVEELLKDKVASERDRIRAKSTFDSRIAELAAAKAKLERTEKGPRNEVLARARARVEEMQAEVARIEDEIEKARVQAPFAGVIVEKFVERGAYLRVGDKLVTIVQLDPIEITVAVPERLFARMPRDLPLTIRFDAFPGEDFSGRIHRIVPVADTLSRTIPVRLRLPNPKGRLLPGMVARALIPTPTQGEVLTVPWDAVNRTPRGQLVYKVVDGKAQPAPITVGARANETVEVRGPLQPGDTIVVRGNERLFPGAPVIVAMPQQGQGGKPGPQGPRGQEPKSDAPKAEAPKKDGN